MGLVSGIRDFSRKNIIPIAVVLFSLFAAFRVLRALGFFGFLGSAGSRILSASALDYAALVVSLAVFFIIFFHSLGKTRRVGLVMLYLATFMLLAGFTQFSQPGWNDAQGYFDIGAKGAEEGPLYILTNYHTLNTGWNEGLIEEVERELEGFGLLEWGREVLELESGDTNSMGSRILKHPPLWPLYISLFMVFLGPTELAALIAVWSVSSLVPVVVFFLVRRFVKEGLALQYSFLSATIPVFLLSGNAPLIDNMALVFSIASFAAFLGAVDSGDTRKYLLSGGFLALGFLTKFTSAFVALPMVLILIERKRERSLPGLVLLALPALAATFLLTFLDYHLLLNLITARASVAYSVPLYNLGFVETSLLPFYYLLYFGIPMVLLAGLYFLGFSGRPGKTQRIALFSLASFLVLLAAYPIKVGIERHLIGMAYLLSVPAAIQYSATEGKKRRGLTIAGILVMVSQAALLA